MRTTYEWLRKGRERLQYIDLKHCNFNRVRESIGLYRYGARSQGEIEHLFMREGFEVELVGIFNGGKDYEDGFNVTGTILLREGVCDLCGRERKVLCVNNSEVRYNDCMICKECIDRVFYISKIKEIRNETDIS